MEALELRLLTMCHQSYSEVMDSPLFPEDAGSSPSWPLPKVAMPVPYVIDIMPLNFYLEREDAVIQCGVGTACYKWTFQMRAWEEMRERKNYRQVSPMMARSGGRLYSVGGMDQTGQTLISL